MNANADAESPENRPTGLDWEGWRRALARFAAATELCVCAYDLDCKRQAGPFAASKVARLLATAGVWNEGRLGDSIERDLAAQVLATGAPGNASVGDEQSVAKSSKHRHGQRNGSDRAERQTAVRDQYRRSRVEIST